MKASELMVGDLVNLSPGKANIPNYVMIHAIEYDNNVSKDYVLDIVFLSTGLVQYNYSIRSLKPIPLTPEILEKNGFVPREDLVEGIDEALPFIYENKETTESIVIGWRDSYDNGLRDENALVLKEYWQINVDGISANYEKTASVLYVHELQHALRLCGIEKEITI